MDYYIKALRYHTGGQPSQYLQFLLDPVLESIKSNELIRQEALGLGISISDEEIEQELEKRGLETNQAVSDIVGAQLLLGKLRQEYFEPQLPLSTEHRNIMAIFLESQGQAAEVRARLEYGEDFARLAAKLSLDSITKEEAGNLGWRPRGILGELLNTPLLDDSVFGSQVELLSQPLYDEEKPKSLGYWLIRVTERREEQEAHVQAILLGSEEEAQSIKGRLDDGEDFNEMANELSQISGAGENRADLGWLTPDGMSQTVSDFIFNPETELDIISEPIRDETVTTEGGYWLFKVTGSDVLEISDEDRELLLNKIQSDWLASLIDDPENRVITYLSEEMKAFAIGKTQAG